MFCYCAAEMVPDRHEGGLSGGFGRREIGCGGYAEGTMDDPAAGRREAVAGAGAGWTEDEMDRACSAALAQAVVEQLRAIKAAAVAAGKAAGS